MEPLRALGVTPLALDVIDEDSCTRAVETIVAAEGRVDILVNNAGYGSYGAIEDVPLAEARRLQGGALPQAADPLPRGIRSQAARGGARGAAGTRLRPPSCAWPPACRWSRWP